MKESGGVAIGKGGGDSSRIVDVPGVSTSAIDADPSPIAAVGWQPLPTGAARMKVDPAEKGRTKRWNTRHLARRVGADVTAAVCAAGLVAPLIVTIDRGIIENASGRASLGKSVLKSLKTFALRPHAFIFSRPFALILTVYSGTYICANVIDTVSSTVRSTPIASTTHGTSKFIGTSTVNLTLGIWKDANLTRLFGTTGPRAIPGPTYALFMLRDSLTMFASFNLPPLLAPYIQTSLLPPFLKGVRKESIAQFIAPAAVQVLSTPLHLLGLDMYNRNGVGFWKRWPVVQSAWAASCFARICRIIPAFGVGGVVNSTVRRNLMERLE